MAYTKYSLTPANNTAAPPDGAPEGMLPSAVNDTFMMPAKEIDKPSADEMLDALKAQISSVYFPCEQCPCCIDVKLFNRAHSE